MTTQFLTPNHIARLFCSLLLITLVGCEEGSHTPQKPVVVSLEQPTQQSPVSREFDQLLEQYHQDSLALNPIQATFEGEAAFNDKFVNPLDPKIEVKLREHFTHYLERISQFADTDLSDSQKMSKAVLIWELEINRDAFNYNADLAPIDQMWSLNLSFGQLASGASAQPFNTYEDYTNWLSRVNGYLEWLASAESKMRKGIDEGWVLPKSLIKKVIPQIEAMTNNDLDSHLFFQPAKNFPDEFSEGQRATLLKAYKAMVAEKIIPAYQQLLDFIQNDYMPAGRDSSGIDALPGGEAYYRHQIKRYTTTNMTADEIHQLGLDEVARILKEMEEVKQQVGYEGDLKSFFDFVRNKKSLMPYKTPEEIIAHYEQIHEKMKPQVSKLFDSKPKTPFEIRRTEAFREKSAAAEYSPGSIDGTRPGIFYTPIPDASQYNIYDSESLFLHEAIPGHHYQISLTQENQDLPKFRKTLWYSGYGEGWALYTESLGKELGLFTDPYQYFGMLGAEMHRAIRLVVDTGLHSKGWTREQAIAYSVANEADPLESIEREIERYMANPGQALAYKIGQLKIRELRNRAETALGDQFNIGQFHNQVLQTGCVPLAVLEAKIDNWIRAQQALSDSASKAA